LVKGRWRGEVVMAFEEEEEEEEPCSQRVSPQT